MSYRYFLALGLFLLAGFFFGKLFPNSVKSEFNPHVLESFNLYKPYNQSARENGYIDLSDYELSILIFLDGSCPTCVIEIEEWKGMIENHNSNDHSFYIILFNEPAPYVHDLINIENYFDLPIYQDKHYSILKKNKIDMTGRGLTLVINSKKQILQRYDSSKPTLVFFE